MDEHNTHPSVLVAETVPVPLASRSAALGADAPANEGKWQGLVPKVLALALLVWLLKRWW